MNETHSLTDVLFVLGVLLALLVWVASGIACVVWTVSEPGAVLVLLLWVFASLGAWMNR